MDIVNSIKCSDGGCCCLPTRTAAILIAMIGFTVGLTGRWVERAPCRKETCCLFGRHVESFRKILLATFQLGNACLLVAALSKTASLIQLYIWSALSFIILGLLLAIADFLYRSKHHGVRCLYVFVPDVALMFVFLRCLILVDLYRRYLEGEADIDF